jgi:hypothetical protein
MQILSKDDLLPSQVQPKLIMPTLLRQAEHRSGCQRQSAPPCFCVHCTNTGWGLVGQQMHRPHQQGCPCPIVTWGYVLCLTFQMLGSWFRWVFPIPSPEGSALSVLSWNLARRDSPWALPVLGMDSSLSSPPLSLLYVFWIESLVDKVSRKVSAFPYLLSPWKNPNFYD